ncbi:MAG TPA: DUF5691 domain-containing protein [Candidatus Thiothrix moscowensis]|uniref:DUF5691 domain-containing protein n=1 Tax=unclassified Thiothrix TaxID=2636184 RepID=UPI0025EE8E21|nr:MULTISPECIES: DUF5691 domain-containing protein [unclassified Thiothrix]HRJ52096.1 DUF5691 domain-containing protein [Candidatus Thiothrix moscowensis]HRJ92393.1 DUF5691 domain-containing protein [Candidatus Thiothrix moscowensis]
MPLQSTLLKIALLGTERQTQVPPANAVLQPYLTQFYPDGKVPTDSRREAAFLGMAALATQYQAAGSLPATFTGILPAPDDKPDLPLIPSAAEIHLRRMLADNNLRPLLDGWLETVASKRLRVAVSFIPALMEQARQSRVIRPLISSVIGQRGHWLAVQNADWQNLLTFAPDADATDVSVWEEGNPAQRSEYLQHLRHQQPAAARELLQTVWKQEAAQVRQDLLQALRTNLSGDDESWLESCLDDRSKGVRQLAAELLGGLPGSAFSQRMQTLLHSWLEVHAKSGLLNKLGGKKQLQINLPENWNKSWLRDGIEEKPPQGKGAKAWWLEQTLSFVPPAYWTQHWQLAPADLLALAQDSDWKSALLDGWQTALLRYPDSDWAKVWLTRTDPRHSPLWQTLAPADAEITAFDLLQRSDSLELLDVLTHLTHPWDQAFSLQVLAQLQTRATRKQQYVYAAHAACRHLAAHLDPACVEDFACLLHEPLQDENHPFHRILTDTLFTLRFRADMLAALETTPPKD